MAAPRERGGAERRRSDESRTRSIAAAWLGTLGYELALAIQRRLAEAVALDKHGETVLLLEHPPVITLGRRGSRADIRVDADELARLGVQVFETNRGGLVTYHGPGQLVGYPIVRLRELAGDAPRYVDGLEQTMIRVLARLGVTAFQHPKHRGVFTSVGKIGAIGVAVSRGVTMHGFALNLSPDLSHFALIDPCGIGDLGVTSVLALTGEAHRPEDLWPAVAEELGLVFDRTIEATSDVLTD